MLTGQAKVIPVKLELDDDLKTFPGIFLQSQVTALRDKLTEEQKVGDRVGCSQTVW